VADRERIGSEDGVQLASRHGPDEDHASGAGVPAARSEEFPALEVLIEPLRMVWKNVVDFFQRRRVGKQDDIHRTTYIDRPQPRLAAGTADEPPGRRHHIDHEQVK
jgi:hypothetical protein